MYMNEIIIEIRGGVVQAAYSNETQTNIIVIDWDDSDSRADSAVAGNIRVDSVSSIPVDTLKTLRKC